MTRVENLDWIVEHEDGELWDDPEGNVWFKAWVRERDAERLDRVPPSLRRPRGMHGLASREVTIHFDREDLQQMSDELFDVSEFLANEIRDAREFDVRVPPSQEHTSEVISALSDRLQLALMGNPTGE